MENVVFIVYIGIMILGAVLMLLARPFRDGFWFGVVCWLCVIFWPIALSILIVMLILEQFRD